MRRALALALMISSLVLTACGAGAQGEEELKQQREAWNAAETLCFTADVSADLGESVFACTLDCAYTPEELRMTILAPELAKGITARKSADDTVLSYDGLELSVGTLTGTRVTPADAVPLLLDALLQGHVTAIYEEKTDETSILCVQVYVDEETYALLRLDGESLSPLEGELVSGGRAAASCRFRDFTAEQEGDDNETPDHEDLG